MQTLFAFHLEEGIICHTKMHSETSLHANNQAHSLLQNALHDFSFAYELHLSAGRIVRNGAEGRFPR